MNVSRNLETRLREALATHVVLYQKARAFHWLVTGRDFFALHERFEALYTDLADAADALAERIVARGGRPLETLAEAVGASRVAEGPAPEGATEMVREIADALDETVAALRHVLEAARESDDVATTSLAEGLVERHEKNAWMFRAFVSGAPAARAVRAPGS